MEHTSVEIQLIMEKRILQQNGPSQRLKMCPQHADRVSNRAIPCTWRCAGDCQELFRMNTDPGHCWRFHPIQAENRKRDCHHRVYNLQFSNILFVMGMWILTRSTKRETRGPRIKSGIYQPPIRTFMDNLTTTTYIVVYNSYTSRVYSVSFGR